MSDTTTITAEEREMWASIATARINAVMPERQCEITAQERLVKSLKALEQAEAENVRLTKIVGNFASIEAGRCADSRTRNGMPLNDMCTVTGQIKAARRAVADSEVKG